MGEQDEKKIEAAPAPPVDPVFTCTKPGREMTTEQGAFVALYHGDSAGGDDYVFQFRRPDKQVITMLRLRKQGLEAVAYLACRELGWFEPSAQTQEAPRG